MLFQNSKSDWITITALSGIKIYDFINLFWRNLNLPLESMIAVRCSVLTTVCVLHAAKIGIFRIKGHFWNVTEYCQVSHWSQWLGNSRLGHWINQLPCSLCFVFLFWGGKHKWLFKVLHFEMLSSIFLPVVSHCLVSVLKIRMVISSLVFYKLG